MLGYEDVPPSADGVPKTTAVPAAHSKGAGIGGTLWIIYLAGIWITRAIIFVGCWIYCIATYGFLLGVGLGWLPSIIVAYLTAWLWPLALAGAVALLIAVVK
jgi:hypothetical protein